MSPAPVSRDGAGPNGVAVAAGQNRLSDLAAGRPSEGKISDVPFRADPLSAALDALWNAAATLGRGQYEVLFREARQAFPVLGGP
jgi:hypothetical protein